MVQIRPAFTDILISVTALCALVLILASFDDRVREQISLRFAPGQASAQAADAGATVRGFTGVVLSVVREYSLAHTPLVIFVLAATVLMFFMLRT